MFLLPVNLHYLPNLNKKRGKRPEIVGQAPSDNHAGWCGGQGPEIGN
jgi:hypothetical protein